MDEQTDNQLGSGQQDQQQSYKQSPQFQRDQSEAEARMRGDQSFVNWGYGTR